MSSGLPIANLRDIPVFDPSRGTATGSFGRVDRDDGNVITSFFDNLWDDIGTTITGFPQGIKVLAKSAGNDIDRLFTGTSESGEFMLDDIANAVVEDYKHVYGPLFSGDVGTTAQRIHEHPLGPILDFATVATLGMASGGTLGVRGAMMGIKGGTMDARMVDRLAGLGGMRRVTEPEGITNFMHTVTKRNDKGEDVEVDLLDDWIVDAEALGGRFIVDKDGRGHVLVPESRELMSRAKNMENSDFASSLVFMNKNPMARYRQKFGVMIANKFPELKYLGADYRVARKERRSDRAKKKAAETRTIGTLTRLMESRLGRKLRDNPRLLTAAELMVNRVNAKDRLDQLDEDMNILDIDAEDVASTKRDPTAAALNADLQGMRDMVQETIDQVEAGTLVGDDLAKTVEGLHDAIGTYGRNLWDDEHGFDGMLARLDEREKAARNADVIKPIMQTTRERINDLVENPLDADELKLVEALADEYRTIGAATTDMLKDMGIDVGVDRHLMPQRVVGKEDADMVQDAVTTPTTLDREYTKSIRDKAEVLTPGTKPANAKFASGYTYRYGLHMLDPDHVLHAYKTAARFSMQRHRFVKNIRRAKVVRVGDVIPKGWGTIPIHSGQFARMQENIAQIVKEEMPIIFGERNPLVAQLQENLTDAWNARIDEIAEADNQLVMDLISDPETAFTKQAQRRSQLQLIAPNAAIKEMFNETRRSTNAWKRFVQEISSVWRFSVLNLRPQWLLNSIVGSSLLLMASTGPIGMMRGLVMANPLGGLSGRGRGFSKVVDEWAGNIRLQGGGRIETEASLEYLDHSIVARALGLNREPNGKLGSVAKRSTLGPMRAIRWWGVKMGKANALMADDYPRRARFYELVRPRAKRLMKHQPGLSFNDAVAQMLTRTEFRPGSAKLRRADFDDPVDLVRGINLTTDRNTGKEGGFFTEADVAEILAGGERTQKWFEKNVDAYNIGRHWTHRDNRDVSESFATDSTSDGMMGHTDVTQQFGLSGDLGPLSRNIDYDKLQPGGPPQIIEGAGVHIGIVMNGGTDARHIVQPFTDEWMAYKRDYGIFDPGSSEAERTVRNGSPTFIEDAEVIITRPGVQANPDGVMSIVPVQQLHRVTDVDALRKAVNAELVPNELVLDELTLKTLDDLVDFDDLTDFERNTLRYMVPFWSWIKGSTKVAARFPMERPLYADLGRILGEQGMADLEEELGFEPESFLRNIVTLGETDQGTQRVVSTAGVNPFVTPLDVGETVRGLVRRGQLRATTNPLNMINPFFKGFGEAAFDRSTFTGGPITGPIAGRDPDETTFGRRFGEQVVRSFPQSRILTETALRDTSRDRAKLFVPGFAPEAARLAGSPLRELNLQQARAKARQFAKEGL